MNIFKIHDNIVTEYKEYIKSFINIKDEQIKAVVDEKIDSGKLWPDPLIQFNPAFEKGHSINELVKSGHLHQDMDDIFKGYDLYRHQVEAINLGISGKDFIVTSGTGSGKSLTYIGTIFNHLLKSEKKKGIKAIIVYPMNALINSQFEEINKYKENYEKETGKEFPVKFGQYTGQERKETRDLIREQMPDIILTNYMMLELILTRIGEKDIRDSIYANLKFLVFDELHTYRGRQGSDVAILIRRIRSQCSNDVTCIGTSATMVTGGTLIDQKEKVAEVGSTIFGKTFDSSRIISEYLIKSLSLEREKISKDDVIKTIRHGIDIDGTEEELKLNPLANWIENEIALTLKEGILVRNRPYTISGVADELCEYTGLNVAECERSILDLFFLISRINKTKTNQRESYLPYKLHQFISQTSTVYTTLGQGENRFITLDESIFKGNEKKPLYPVVFSRTSGYPFICVTKQGGILHKRDFQEITENDSDEEDVNYNDGYLIISDKEEDVWDPVNDLEKLPMSWFKYKKSGSFEVIKKYEKRFPGRIYFNESGLFSESEKDSDRFPFKGWYMPAPLFFDPTAGIIFRGRTSDNTKLTKLGSEGRSTSTTILTFLILKNLEKNNFSFQDQKLLSFTDNRQDAALQAAHFNDFIDVVKLRSALYRAVNDSPTGSLDYTSIAGEVFKALNLDQKAFARGPSDFPGKMKDNQDAFKDLLMYRIIYDLRRSWRVILPNLEYCALLKIDYRYLDDVCSDDDRWKDIPVFNMLTSAERREEVFRVLDYIRKLNAIHSEEYFKDESTIESKFKRIRELINEEWGFDENEKIEQPNYITVRPIKRQRGDVFTESIGSRSSLGLYLKSAGRKFDLNFKEDDYNNFIKDLMELFCEAGWLRSFSARNEDDEQVNIYRLSIDVIIWKAGDGRTVIADYIRTRSYKDNEMVPNYFFSELYKSSLDSLNRLNADDHTGQVQNDERQVKEERFREGEIKALYCSPTMELGIDIKDLSIVHMRNVPPNPANYVQRSGRAGRQGQPALIFTFCSSFAPHDRHYFNNSTDMVAGIVMPPRIDLANEDLLRSHLHSIYLAHKGINQLRNSITSLVDTSDKVNLPLSDDVKASLKMFSDSEKDSVRNIFNKVISDFRDKLESRGVSWFNDKWVESVIENAAERFDEALNRWRLLYNKAYALLQESSSIQSSRLYSTTSQEMKNARRDIYQSQKQLDILENSGYDYSFSEFYPYRYLAAEGYLPGYNFYRLPVRTYIPSGDSGVYVSRPRFIALQEFGPQNIIYYKGRKYRINQMLVSDIENSIQEGRICRNSGYFLEKDELHYENCPFTGESLSEGNSFPYQNLLEMNETKTESRERISCEEEERTRLGFNVETYFSVPAGMSSVYKGIVKSDEDEFLHISYIPTARLIQINTRWRNKKEDGFIIGINSGLWKKEHQADSARAGAEETRNVRIITADTAASLYIEPIKALNLSPDGVVTLQYALKRAIENLFQIEPSELAVVLIGNPSDPNIFIYESAEGSLGILSQFIEDKSVFNAVIDEAYRLCRFDDESYTDPAGYDDLLSYYNQRDHERINRMEIRSALETLKVCRFEIITNKSFSGYKQHFEYLMSIYDQSSSTEREFLRFLNANGLRLPDAAQKEIDGIYVRPDFYYEPGIHIFCDGTPHDRSDVMKNDSEVRQAIINRGEEALVYNYRDSLDEFVKRRPDIFKKVR
jgi:superfamily II DNA/RNA helicase